MENAVKMWSGASRAAPLLFALHRSFLFEYVAYVAVRHKADAREQVEVHLLHAAVVPLVDDAELRARVRHEKIAVDAEPVHRVAQLEGHLAVILCLPYGVELFHRLHPLKNKLLALAVLTKYV